jgi:hypothetical protein
MKPNEVQIITESKIRRTLSSNFSVLHNNKRIKAIHVLLGCLATGLIYAFLFSGSSAKKDVTVSADEIHSDVPTHDPSQNIELNSLPKSRRGKKTSYFEAPRVFTRFDALQIPTGTKVKVKLLNAVSKGVAKAVLEEDFVFEGESVATKGSLVLGKVKDAKADRILIDFSQMTAITGDKFNIQAYAVDTDELEGLAPNIAHKKAWNVATKFAFNFLGGLTDGLQSRSYGGAKGGSISNALLEGSSRAATDEARNTVSEAQNKDTITPILAGKTFTIEFQGKPNE